ncbi:unnamed protein product [Taenia asiatica]|uniref:ATE_C domain-containing protein n=1 Tax=Taenia asiatica TaxID=60517 RepID=A0A0R3WDS3_TAEAS|nr:unnamed protein product [Taenia asiatica]
MFNHHQCSQIYGANPQINASTSQYSPIVHAEGSSRSSSSFFPTLLLEGRILRDIFISAHDAEAKARGAPQFGSYHQQHWLDGEKLIAVGVVDLVPGRLSICISLPGHVFCFLMCLARP